MAGGVAVAIAGGVAGALLAAVVMVIITATVIVCCVIRQRRSRKHEIAGKCPCKMLPIALCCKRGQNTSTYTGNTESSCLNIHIWPSHVLQRITKQVPCKVLLIESSSPLLYHLAVCMFYYMLLKSSATWHGMHGIRRLGT